MSKYTTEVRFICESSAGLTDSMGFNSTNDVITKAMPKVFNFDFPIFDEAYRPVIERKILRHFYTREICEETVGLWKLRLEDKLNIIMPYYNQLYKSELLEFNPFYDVDLSTTKVGQKDEKVSDKNKHDSVTAKERKNDSSNESNIRAQGNSKSLNTDHETGNGNENSGSWDLYSDTPQGGITGIANAYSDDINLANNSYLTNARNVTGNANNNYKKDSNGQTANESSSEETSKNNLTVKESNKDINSSEDNRNKTAQNLENYLEKVHGKRGGKSFSSLLNEYRSTFLNIDNMILEELEPLFMQLW